jgi:hypothetical protein
LWFVDPDLLRRRKRLRWFPNEPLGMSCVGSVENGASPLDGLMRQTVMHHSRREKSFSRQFLLTTQWMAVLTGDPAQSKCGIRDWIMSKPCPACKILNPDTGQRCDCGYDFDLRKMKQPYAEPTKT